MNQEKFVEEIIRRQMMFDVVRSIQENLDSPDKTLYPIEIERSFTYLSHQTEEVKSHVINVAKFALHCAVFEILTTLDSVSSIEGEDGHFLLSFLHDDGKITEVLADDGKPDCLHDLYMSTYPEFLTQDLP